jgi:hypothetical protein
MNAPTVVRRPNGTMMKGFTANPGGRPRHGIEQLRAEYLPKLPIYFAALERLMRSDNEFVQLAALREAFDRLLGKSTVCIDSEHTRFDIRQAYVRALAEVNASARDTADAEPCEPTEPQD